jgi:hypothetical protein
MEKDIERIPVKPKRRRRKALYFTSKKKRFRLSVGKKNANKEGKKNCCAPLHEECLQHQGHKGDPGVTPGTCDAIGERDQVILMWVRPRAFRTPPTHKD